MKKIMTKAAGGSMKNKWIISVGLNFCAPSALFLTITTTKTRRKFLFDFWSNMSRNHSVLVLCP